MTGRTAASISEWSKGQTSSVTHRGDDVSGGHALPVVRAGGEGGPSQGSWRTRADVGDDDRGCLSGTSSGKLYRRGHDGDRFAFAAATDAFHEAKGRHLGEFPLAPDEPLAEDPRNIWCNLYGLDTFGKLFNDRQLLSLTTFTRLVGEAHAEMLRAGLNNEYTKAVGTYLGLLIDRLAAQQSTLSRWHPQNEQQLGAYARQGTSDGLGLSGGCPYRIRRWKLVKSAIRQLEFLESAVVCSLAPGIRQV